ncbi:MAG: D-alanine--D-alanine ligase, partial [Methylophilaceae bacterium]
EIIPKNEFYDYDAKYISDETTFLQPKDLSQDQLKNLYDSAIKAFSSIGCRGWGRVDFIMDSKASFYLIEINTVPGMTGHSLFPLSAKNAGLSFEQVVKRILNLIE